MAGRPKSRARKNRALAAAAAAPLPDALERFKQAGVECGFDTRAMERFAARLRKRPRSANGRLKLDDRELLALIDDRLVIALECLDDVVLGEANARELVDKI